MSFRKWLGFAGMAVLLACGHPTLAQTPNQIPMGAGAGVDRQPPGSRFRNPTGPQTTAPATALPPAAASRDKAAISASCSQQANAKGLHGKARKSFREKCKKNGGN